MNRRDTDNQITECVLLKISRSWLFCTVANRLCSSCRDSIGNSNLIGRRDFKSSCDICLHFNFMFA